ncbi:MAG TPA: pseudouridine-5'-phosphate glycosidase [Bacillales bacterium]|nr:pseudouridine-5'-phosphate glycosidase [Bacillales bacterium]
MDYIKVNEEVQSALAESRPVVALESTIISHGMPYPDNIRMALEVEDLIRKQGAVPATIAIMDGQIRVGLSKEEIERLGNSEEVYKTSIRDFPRVLSAKMMGATTVAATAYAASKAGIRFFATGGLGGVHRDVPETFDVSADLMALAKSNICLVSAGAKSILDIPKTLEYLETLGVPVYGYETDHYPGFYVRNSGQQVEKVSHSELVDLLKVKEQMDFEGAVVVGVPVPEESELDPDLVEKTINDALLQANRAGITGKEVTPFLLSKMEEKTGGESLKTNIALMKNNATTAAKIAAAYYGS